MNSILLVIGWPQIVLIVVIVLILFGGKKLPDSYEMVSNLDSITESLRYMICDGKIESNDGVCDGHKWNTTGYCSKTKFHVSWHPGW